MAARTIAGISLPVCFGTRIDCEQCRLCPFERDCQKEVVEEEVVEEEVVEEARKNIVKDQGIPLEVLHLVLRQALSFYESPATLMERLSTRHVSFEGKEYNCAEVLQLLTDSSAKTGPSPTKSDDGPTREEKTEQPNSKNIKKKPLQDRAICINNLGMENRFDPGAAYVFERHGDSSMIWVFDKLGEKCECFRERFQMPCQYEEEEEAKRWQEEEDNFEVPF
jgi:hypothetical protein